MTSLPGGPQIGLTRRPAQARGGFSLVELLIVIGIIALLIAILLPALAGARRQANAINCASNLRSIGQAVSIYLVHYNNQTPPFRDYSTITDPNHPLQYIDPNDPNAYWGVYYAVEAHMPKKIFNCPSEVQKNDQTGYQNQFIGYGYNGWGDGISGLTNADRLRFFGSTTDVALFRNSTNNWATAVGQNVVRDRFPSRTIVAQDAWESVVDGGNNGDTYASSTATNRGQLTEYPGHDIEYLRHNKTSNVLFLDGHVEPLNKAQQTDERYYTGKWDLARSY